MVSCKDDYESLQRLPWTLPIDPKYQTPVHHLGSFMLIDTGVFVCSRQSMVESCQLCSRQQIFVCVRVCGSSMKKIVWFL